VKFCFSSKVKDFPYRENDKEKIGKCKMHFPILILIEIFIPLFKIR